MRNNIRLFPFRQGYTRRSCISNKSITHTQNNRPNSSFRKIILAPSYNILFTSIVTSIFAQKEND